MIQKVVGIAFIENGKLLIVQSHRSSQTNSWTFVGGGVEEGETLIEAAIREVSEEIHNNFSITASDLEELFTFTEQAASDPNKMIEMTDKLCPRSRKINFCIHQFRYELLKFIQGYVFIESSSNHHQEMENYSQNC